MATLKQLYNITVDIFLVYFGSGNKVSDLATQLCFTFTLSIFTWCSFGPG